MNIDVRSFTCHQEVEITDGNASLNTGLMDDGEQWQLALEFLEAAESLTPDRFTDAKSKILELLEQIR